MESSFLTGVCTHLAFSSVLTTVSKGISEEDNGCVLAQGERTFFTSKALLPQDTPQRLRELRQRELYALQVRASACIRPPPHRASCLGHPSSYVGCSAKSQPV